METGQIWKIEYFDEDLGEDYTNYWLILEKEPSEGYQMVYLGGTLEESSLIPMEKYSIKPNFHLDKWELAEQNMPITNPKVGQMWRYQSPNGGEWTYYLITEIPPISPYLKHTLVKAYSTATCKVIEMYLGIQKPDDNWELVEQNG